jgi:hypothetical protein
MRNRTHHLTLVILSAAARGLRREVEGPAFAFAFASAFAFAFVFVLART